MIGSRYTRGGGVLDWGIGRRVISRGGSLFARTVLGLKPHDLTGGFKAWRRAALEAIDWERVHSGGYVFQIETTYLASRAGARVAETPIIFVDRRVGVSKMSRNIIAGGADGRAPAALGRAARSRPEAREVAATADAAAARAPARRLADPGTR